MKYGLAYPTRRAHCIAPVVKMWEDRAADKSRLTWCIGVDKKDYETEIAAGLRFVAYGGNNYVQAANAACAKLADKGVDYLIVVSDDFIPPFHWDVALDRVIAENGNTTSAVLHVNDGGSGDLCTLPIVGINRYWRFGYMYHPSYESMFCDTELTARAQLDCSLVDARHLLFEHLHPVNKKRPMDAVDKAHASDARFARGKEIFQRRLAIGFPPDTDPTDRPPVMADRYVASLMVCRDDVCLGGVVEALFRDGVRSFAFNVPLHHWDGSEVSLTDRQQVRDVANELVKRGAHFVRVYEDSLAPFHFPGQARWRLETHYRNFNLQRLRALGFQHHLIVDGDELFMAGALAALDYNVRWHNPPTAALRGIPLVGLPAVAVEGATDRITCYIGNGETWRDIRSPHQPTLDVGVFGILHFSAVRRTREELIAKMRGSGHYDDADYRFEDWIANTLPNIKPGMVNVHMYRDGSLWPLARELKPEEWAAIPASVKPLLWKGE
jgi:hypothetical protein